MSAIRYIAFGALGFALCLCLLPGRSALRTNASSGAARPPRLAPSTEMSAATSVPREDVWSEHVLKLASVVYKPVKSLRSIDFANFTYPYAEGVDSYESEGGFKLRNGVYGDRQLGWALEEVSFGDVTGDGTDEAIITLHELNDGSGSWSRGYIFTLEDRRPKVIWAFHSGDRADGGLVRAYGRDGKLVIELFGKGTSIEGTMSDGDFNGLANPKWITRARYEWRSDSFERRGELEIMPNPAAEADCPTCYPRSEPREYSWLAKNRNKDKNRNKERSLLNKND